jgi:hypothetical protein
MPVEYSRHRWPKNRPGGQCLNCDLDPHEAKGQPCICLWQDAADLAEITPAETPVTTYVRHINNTDEQEALF